MRRWIVSITPSRSDSTVSCWSASCLPGKKTLRQAPEYGRPGGGLILSKEFRALGPGICRELPTNSSRRTEARVAVEKRDLMVLLARKMPRGSLYPETRDARRRSDSHHLAVAEPPDSPKRQAPSDNHGHALRARYLSRNAIGCLVAWCWRSTVHINITSIKVGVQEHCPTNEGSSRGAKHSRHPRYLPIPALGTEARADQSSSLPFLLGTDTVCQHGSATARCDNSIQAWLVLELEL